MRLPLNLFETALVFDNTNFQLTSSGGAIRPIALKYIETIENQRYSLPADIKNVFLQTWVR